MRYILPLLGFFATVVSEESCRHPGDMISGAPCDKHDLKEVTQLHLSSGEEPRDTPWGAGMITTTLDVDVLVAGGGSAGTAAAIAAARNGARTVLVSGRSMLGGNAASEIRVKQVGACGPRSSDDNALTMECREGGIVEEYTLDFSASTPTGVPEFFSLAILTKIKAEPNITLLQDTWLVSATTVKEGNVSRYVVTAKVFIDGTGDGRLGAEAGATWLQGREGPMEYNESLATGPDHETEGSSLIYHTMQQPDASPWQPPFWASSYNESQFQYRSVTGNPGVTGYWWNEISYPYNTITDGENVTDELLKDMFGIWDYIKNSGNHPESKNVALSWFGFVAGKREGRRFVGKFVSSQNDIMRDPSAKVPQEPTMYWDRIGHGGWNFDLHNPKGMRDPSHPPFVSYKTPYMFSTALGSLVSKDLTNLFFAGRLASFSHVVYGSQRVMKSCAVHGQAAGTAAAYAVRNGVDPIAVADDRGAVWSIQQQLLRDDQYIIGLYNEDPRDYARNATVTASSETTATGNSTIDGSAVNVISGQSRAVVGILGVPASQGKQGSNRWISNGLPASISLSLQRAASIEQVQLVFDTGMHRKLTNFYPTMDGPLATLGAQHETVRDYVIEGMDAATGKWVMLCNVTDNYQRRRVHDLPCPPPQNGPSPPPPPVQVPGTVFAQICNTASAAQQWSINASTGEISTIVNGTAVMGDATPERLCLGVDPSHTAYGGETQAVVARPCEAGGVKSWTWSAEQGGNFLRLANNVSYPCVVHSDNFTCQCAHITACAACHSTTFYPGASVELWPCNADSLDVHWSFLVDRGVERPGNTGLLMAGGLCLSTVGTGPTMLSARTPQAPKPDGSLTKSDASGAAPRRGSLPALSNVRVTVTATNGVPNAHVNEIRLYDANGRAPFPTKP